MDVKRALNQVFWAQLMHKMSDLGTDDNLI